jgi:branched-chain amino acid transport system permease protein
MGSVYGAVAAGMMLGITESLAAGFLGNQLKDIVAFALVVAVLLIKPSGLFGSSAARA